MDTHTPAPDDYSSAIYLRCPPALPTALKAAARQNMTSVSAYVRQSVISQLRRDGIDMAGQASV